MVLYLSLINSLVVTVQSHPSTSVRNTVVQGLQPRQSGNSNETAAPSPPWVDAGAWLQEPPSCVGNNIPCKLTPTRTDDCSATKCVTAFDGACMERAKRTDLSCLCKTLSSQNCGACSTPMERAGYHHWLNLTCGVLPEWRGEGLPKNWTSGFQSLDMMEIGNHDEPRGCAASTATRFEAGLNMPACVSRECPVYEKGWRDSIYNGKDTAWTNYSISKPADAFWDTNCGLFLSRAYVCGDLQQAVKGSCPETMCSTRLERTQYLLWLNKT